MREEPDWRFRYARRLAVTDACAVLWATVGALVFRFGSSDSTSIISKAGIPYISISVVLAFSWWLMLSAWGTRDTRILGHGTDEYKRVVSSSLWLFGLIAIVSYTFQFDTARGYVGIALPAGVVILLLSRYLIRQLLQLERSAGNSMSRVLIIGGPGSAEHLARSLTLQPMAGYTPVATYLPGTPDGTTVAEDLNLPTLGHKTDPESIVSTIKEYKPDAVALSSGVHLQPKAIRALGWALADMDVRMIMAPALTDIAGPRIHTQPVAGLPLIHVSTPNLAPAQRLVKRAFDVAGAGALVLLFSPLFLVIAVLVRIDSPGPILFRQERVGIQGTRFQMLKFRSMVVNAEEQLRELHLMNQGHGVLFKIKDDPRVTKVGQFIRRYSLDELPQLFNVLSGRMSLVGPRPPLRAEVDQYEDHVHRRLLVRPGLTGLWQVSGRSLLSWEDTVRLDLYYVENWSLSGDISILLRTFRAVISRHGAY